MGQKCDLISQSTAEVFVCRKRGWHRTSSLSDCHLSTQGRGIRVVEPSDATGDTGTFLIVWKHGDRSRVRIQASNGLFEQIFNSTSQICIFIKIGKFTT